MAGPVRTLEMEGGGPEAVSPDGGGPADGSPRGRIRGRIPGTLYARAAQDLDSRDALISGQAVAERSEEIRKVRGRHRVDVLPLDLEILVGAPQMLEYLTSEVVK